MPVPQPAPRPVAARPPAPTTSPLALTAAGTQPKIRLQAPDELLPQRKLALPAPEVFGLAVAGPGFRNQLSRLGVTNYRVDRLNQGGYRAVLLMAGRQPQSSHLIESTAQTEAAAMALATERAEDWRRLNQVGGR